MNSNIIQFKLTKPLTQNELNALQAALVQHQAVASSNVFCLAGCQSSRLELLNMFRGLEDFEWLSLQMDYPLKLSLEEFGVVCHIIQDAKESLNMLSLSIPEGNEQTVYQALANNYYLTTINLFGQDEFNSMPIGWEFAVRNKAWLDTLENWVCHDLMESDSKGLPPRPLQNVIEFSADYQLHEGLKGLRQPLTDEGNWEVFQILTQCYPHPTLQSTASHALGYFLYLNPNFFKTNQDQIAQSLFILNAFQDLDLDPTDESDITRATQIMAVAYAIQKLQQKELSLVDVRAFLSGNKVLLNSFVVGELIDKARETLTQAQDPASKNELNLLNAISNQQNYHPLFMDYLLQCPSFVRQLKMTYPSSESFYIIDDGLFKNSVIREKSLTDGQVVKPDQQGIPKDLCPDFAATLRAAPALVPIDIESIRGQIRACVLPHVHSRYRMFQQEPQAESSDPRPSSSHQLGKS
ncbi:MULTISPECIES: hypothetical protein [Legionella]|uniref:hypothetical protein n=1 Tax=Legionella TaxID=445 RepID=UPI00095CA9C8|nr:MULTISPECIES: hypothetical protein [Legionella]MBN9227897.1 hypothetical protein [Legionella steelei]OJW10205.1 MAG: hypothetical protein BGO44_00015 [Legionella sp. 39-23]